MGFVGRNKSFLITAVLILAIGAVIFGSVSVVRVMAAGSATPAPAVQLKATADNNSADSYGITGYSPITLTATDSTPGFVAKRLKDQRGMVLLIYVKGAGADMDMLESFNAVKAIYAADASFFSFNAGDVKQTGDLLDQLKVTDPPVLAIVNGSGKVDELYTGWIDRKVMEQRVADALRGS
jgi:hypothetical protein